MTKNGLKELCSKYNIENELIVKIVSILESVGILEDLHKMEPLGKGMTNQTFLLEGKENYLLRLSGAGTGNIINRKQEAAVYAVLEGKNISDEVIYINPDDGIKISKYLEGFHVCDIENKTEVEQCICYLREFHNKSLQVGHAFDLFAEIRLYESQCGIYFDAFPDVRETREQVMSLRELIKQKQTKNCLCHIDSVYDNFLVKDNNIHLIDWEYSGMGDPLLDVAMFCIYANFDKEKTDWVIQTYLQERDCEELRMLIYAYMSAASYLWVLWSEIKWFHGEDFHEYEQQQYTLAKTYYKYALELYKKQSLT